LNGKATFSNQSLKDVPHRQRQTDKDKFINRLVHSDGIWCECV